MKANNKPPGKTIHASYIVDMEKGMELPMVLRVQIASTFSIMYVFIGLRLMVDMHDHFK